MKTAILIWSMMFPLPAMAAGAIPVAQIPTGPWKGHVVMVIPAEDMGTVIHALRQSSDGGFPVNSKFRDLVRRIYPLCGGMPASY